MTGPSKATVTAVYRPASLVVGIVSGMLARTAVKRAWQGVRHDDTALEPTDRKRGWGEVLVGAAVLGMVYGVTRTAVDRAGAQAVHRMTGSWPTA